MAPATNCSQFKTCTFATDAACGRAYHSAGQVRYDSLFFSGQLGRSAMTALEAITEALNGKLSVKDRLALQDAKANTGRERYKAKLPKRQEPSRSCGANCGNVRARPALTPET